jgi:putative glutamine amidotransferase
VSRSQPPRVGLSAYREDTRWGAWHERADLLSSTYSDAVAAAGAVPLLLPVASKNVEGGTSAALDSVHGLILTGGPDVDPSLYGQERHPETDEPRTTRDSWEWELAHEAMRRDIPLLGICRGLQLLNVALGGGLIQHLPDVVGSDGHRPVVGEFTIHSVSTAPGSRIAGIMGGEASIPSHHHQAIGSLAAGLVPTGWAPDGTIEAVEMPARTWTVAVQWHPEEGGGEPLFQAFVDAARAYRESTALSPAETGA